MTSSASFDYHDVRVDIYDPGMTIVGAVSRLVSVSAKIREFEGGECEVVLDQPIRYVRLSTPVHPRLRVSLAGIAFAFGIVTMNSLTASVLSWKTRTRKRRAAVPTMSL